MTPVESSARKDLKALVKQAKGVDTKGKTAESVKALTDAIAYAEDVLADENSSDAQVQTAYGQLKLAIEGLKDAEQSGNLSPRASAQSRLGEGATSLAPCLR